MRTDIAMYDHSLIIRIAVCSYLEPLPIAKSACTDILLYALLTSSLLAL